MSAYAGFCGALYLSSNRVAAAPVSVSTDAGSAVVFGDLTVTAKRGEDLAALLHSLAERVEVATAHLAPFAEAARPAFDPHRTSELPNNSQRRN